MNTNDLKSLILDTLKTYNKKRIRRRELFNRIGIRGLDYQEFSNILTDMVKSGEIVRMKGRRFSLPEKSGVVTGVFSTRRNGGGFIRTADGESVYVRQSFTEGALPGDKVQGKLLKRGRAGPSKTAKITAILERSTKPVIGVFRKRGKTAYIIPQDEGFVSNLLIKNNAELDASDGELVVARVGKESAGFSRPLCSVVEVLGDPDAPGVDVLAIIKRYDLPMLFPDEVIEESERLRVGLVPDVLGKRKDLRGAVTFTIDPVDARDFDDALSISCVKEGVYELGIHIADVSHYVGPGSAMDREAASRGMSCYFVDRVIPMLPEKLSNDLCSLKPKVDRLTKSVIIRLDRDGSVLSHEIANTVIHSHRRLTYEQVQSYLDGDSKHGADEIPADVGEALRMLSKLTDILIANREKRGTIDFELPEARVVLDSEGKPVDIVKRERLKAHRIVEEAMILANIITAERLGDADAPFLYRIHDKPDEAKMAVFGEIALLLGYDFQVSRIEEERYIQRFLESLRGKKHEKLLNTLLLRSMKKAAYAPDNIGHYGLGLPAYAHFTSPIRRYPDLIVHRQLDSFLLCDGGGKTGRSDKTSLEDLGSMITGREITIDAAERDSIKMKTAEFMQNHLGEEFDGTVSGIMPFGFFVELDRYFVEGLIHVSSLEDDYYEVDSSGFALVGKRSGKRFIPGDRLRVVVSRADKKYGEVDFMLVARLKNKKP